MANPQSEYLKSLSEKDFRERILLPLYRKMGFEEVEVYHGGILEQGKDLTMWKEHDGQRRNYAVVVKKGDLTGAVSGSNNAGQVATQVRQCFGATFKDKHTLEERQVHFCYVVASGSIAKETRYSLQSQLGDFRERLELFGGDDILALLQSYKVPIGSVAQVCDLQAKLSEAVTDAEISVIVASNSRPTITIAPKAGAKPFQLKLRVSIDKSSPQGQALDRAVQEFRDKGGSVTIPADAAALEASEVSSLLEKLGLPRTFAGELTIQQIPYPVGIFSLVRETDDQETAALDNMSLIMTKIGVQSAEFKTKPKSSAFEFCLTMYQNRGVKYEFIPSIYDRNVKEIYDVLKFELTLAKPGILTVVNRVNDLTLFSGHTEAQDVPESIPVNERLFSELVIIQRRTNQRLNFTRDLTDADLQQIGIVYAAVTAGFYDGTKFSFSITDLSPDVESLVGQPIDLRVEGQRSEIFEILDTDVDLGPVQIIATNCTLSLETNDVGEHLVVVNPNPGTITVEFPKWKQKLAGEVQSASSSDIR